MTEPASSERAPLDPTLGLSDFLAGAQVLNNVSQAELAEQIGVSQQSVSRWLNGRSSPSAHRMRVLTDLFQLTDEEATQLALNNGPRTVHQVAPAPQD